MKILALDTALSACSACVLADGAEAPESIETLPMERGHAEALLPLVDRVMARAEGGFESLGRIAVTVGPGSFTGLRVGLAAARAFGLARRIPVAGISTLAAIAAPLVIEQKPGLVVSAIDARHGNVYFAAFGPYGRAVIAPRMATAREAVRALGAGPVRLAGPGARLLASEASAAGTPAEIAQQSGVDIVYVARLGLLADPRQTPPRPVYLSAVTAKVKEMQEPHHPPAATAPAP